MRGIFLDIDSVDRGDIKLDDLRATLPEWVFLASGTAKVAEAARNADILVSNKVILDKSIISRTENLKLICIAATGTNNVDLAAAAEKGITVCNARSYATASVVEHVLSLILCLNRSLPQYFHAVSQGEWEKSGIFCMLDYPIRELAGQTMGIIGPGEIGSAVAEMAGNLGMRVLIAERRGAPPRTGRTSFDEVLSRADIISLHCPLTADTRNLIGEPELARMRPNAILINTARGGIVNESDLVAALLSGQIGGAGIDVLVTEPPSTGSPLLSLSLPNLIVTPHIAWASRTARQRLVNEITGNILAFLAGSPRNIVQLG
jgi:glycerate dehydrogenase